MISKKNNYPVEKSSTKGIPSLGIQKHNGKVLVVHEEMKTEQYETAGSISRFFHFVWVIFLNILPIKLGTKIFTQSSRDAKTVRDNATTYKALEIMYNFQLGTVFRNGMLDGLFTYIWHHLYSVRGTRNRLKMVKKLLRQEIDRLLLEKKEINVLSLGSGSARAVLETIKEYKGDVVINFLGIDKNNYAIAYCKKLAAELGVHRITLVQDKVTNILSILQNNNFSPDIVEMVGLLDYFTQDKAIRLMKMIKENMHEKAALITCNIRENPEKKFVTSIVSWPMVYRTEMDMSEIITQSGFEPQKAKLIIDPLKVHMLALIHT